MLYMHSICIFLWAACSLYVSLCYVRCVAWGWWALSKHPTYLQSEVHHAFHPDVSSCLWLRQLVPSFVSPASGAKTWSCCSARLAAHYLRVVSAGHSFGTGQAGASEASAELKHPALCVNWHVHLRHTAPVG